MLRKGIQDRYETYLSDAISNAARFSDQLGLSVDNTLDKQNKGKGVGFCWSAALDYLPLHVTVPLNDPEAKSGVGPVAVNVIVALVPQFPVIEMGTRTPGPHAPWGLKLPVNEKVTLFVDTEVIGPDAVAPGLKPTIVIVHVPCPAVIPPAPSNVMVAVVPPSKRPPHGTQASPPPAQVIVPLPFPVTLGSSSCVAP